MRRLAYFPIFFLLFIATICNCKTVNKPEQIHLSFGNTVDDIVVTWSTMNQTKSKPVVKHWTTNSTKQSKGTTELFVDGGRKKLKQYIHRVTLYNVSRDTLYKYQCGGGQSGWSKTYSFKTPPKDEVWQPSLAVYGDMGLKNYHALPRVTTESRKGMYDAVFHIGDFGYDMDSDNGEVGNKFMRLIEPLAATVPYMTCVGNHENAYNFSHYRYRFSMPGEKERSSVTYSINMGPLHIISISTEVYYFRRYGMQPMINQFAWLKQDLINANLPANRARQPWIVVMGHRPMYCSNIDHEDCVRYETYTRRGIPIDGKYRYGMEKLFYDYGVDVILGAHEHSYERLWPIYDYKVYNGSLESPYTNPKAPVHMTSGSAGCQEKKDPFWNPGPLWSAFRSNDYGSARLKAYNATHMHIEQVSDEKNGTVIDSFWIIKDKHGFYEDSDMSLERILEESRHYQVELV